MYGVCIVQKVKNYDKGMTTTRKTIRRASALGLLLLLCMGLVPALAADYSLTTEYTAGNHAPGIMFNLELRGTQDLMITSFDINLTSSLPLTVVRVYIRPGGYEGYENDAAAWTLAGQATVAAQGKNNTTHLPVGGIRLTAGETYGVYMATDGAASDTYMRYTEPASVPDIQNDTMRLFGGAGHGSPDFGGFISTPRLWNGTVYYADIPVPTAAPAPAAGLAPQTGDQSGAMLGVWGLMAILTLAAAGGMGAVYQKRRRG